MIESGKSVDETSLGLPRIMGWLLLAFLVTGPLAATTSHASDRAAGYRIVVHASNPVSSLSKKEVSKIFLKKTRKWGHIKRVVPIDLPQASKAREAFSADIMGRTVKAVRSYWRLEAVAEGRSQPPELASEREVLEYVATDPAAIGYVSTDAGIDDYDVKTIQIIE